jgi:hypothetical protein
MADVEKILRARSLIEMIDVLLSIAVVEFHSLVRPNVVLHVYPMRGLAVECG